MKKKLNVLELYNALKEQMPPEYIDHYYSDLYVKVTPISTDLIAQYENKFMVSKFIDNIEHKLWYEIPFGYCDYDFVGNNKKLK